MKNKVIYWFYSTWLGGKYLEFLLWLDDIREPAPIITHKEVNEIVIQAQQLLYREGIAAIKRRVRAVVEAPTKEEYEKALQQIEDLIPLAEQDSEYRKLKATLSQAYVRKGKDIKTAADHARMIQSRINDFQELREFNEKKKLLRTIREHRKLGNEKVAEKLEQEFKERYVRRIKKS